MLRLVVNNTRERPDSETLAQRFQPDEYMLLAIKGGDARQIGNLGKRGVDRKVSGIGDLQVHDRLAEQVVGADGRILRDANRRVDLVHPNHHRACESWVEAVNPDDMAKVSADGHVRKRNSTTGELRLADYRYLGTCCLRLAKEISGAKSERDVGCTCSLDEKQPPTNALW